MSNLTDRLKNYPAVVDLQKRAKKRLPLVAWEYLDMGTDNDKTLDRNRDALNAITFLPQFMQGNIQPDLKTSVFGREYSVPFGVAPVGLTGLMWPRTELILAKSAAKYRFPYTLSMVATQTPEAVGAVAGDMGWFQLYPPRDPKMRADVLKRAKDSGFTTLVVTADIPAPSGRQRSVRAGLTMPPKITPRFIWQGITHPAWTIATLREGLPNLRTLNKYSENGSMQEISVFVAQELGGTLDWDYLKEVRDLWDGPMVVKGIMRTDDAQKCIEIGAEGIQVSNHGGRQLDGAPAAIDMLPIIAESVGDKATILFDSGVRTGLDIIRALALGADFVFLGRAFISAVGAFGDDGGDHVANILMSEMKNDMANIGVKSIAEVKAMRENGFFHNNA
ncbi:MAG: alpha-hydroxy acid oxidase [Anaerolineae bacterium]